MFVLQQRREFQESISTLLSLVFILRPSPLIPFIFSRVFELRRQTDSEVVQTTSGPCGGKKNHPDEQVYHYNFKFIFHFKHLKCHKANYGENAWNFWFWLITVPAITSVVGLNSSTLFFVACERESIIKEKTGLAHRERGRGKEKFSLCVNWRNYKFIVSCRRSDLQVFFSPFFFFSLWKKTPPRWSK